MATTLAIFPPDTMDGSIPKDLGPRLTEILERAGIEHTLEQEPEADKLLVHLTDAESSEVRYVMGVLREKKYVVGIQL